MDASVLGASCESCHGPGGHSMGAIPSIDQLDAAAIAASLRAFKSDQIQATVMNRIAKGFTDGEIDALARYFAAH